MRSLFFLPLFIVLITFSSCNYSSSNSVIIARVEKSVLTEPDLSENLGSAASKASQRRYTQRWIERELLYYAARDAKIHQDHEIERTLEESKRNLLSMTYLNRNVESGPVVITADAIEQYYNENSDQFVRNDDVIRFAQYSLNSMRDAWSVRNGLNANNFFSSAGRYSKVAVIPKIDIPFVTRNSLPEDLQEKLFDIRVGGLTTPIRVGEYVNLYLILDKGEVGSSASLQEVYSSVQSRLMQVQYQVRIDSVMSIVKSERNYSFNHQYFDTATPVVVSVEGARDE